MLYNAKKKKLPAEKPYNLDNGCTSPIINQMRVQLSQNLNNHINNSPYKKSSVSSSLQYSQHPSSQAGKTPKESY